MKPSATATDPAAEDPIRADSGGDDTTPDPAPAPSDTEDEEEEGEEEEAEEELEEIEEDKPAARGVPGILARLGAALGAKAGDTELIEARSQNRLLHAEIHNLRASLATAIASAEALETVKAQLESELATARAAAASAADAAAASLQSSVAAALNEIGIQADAAPGLQSQDAAAASADLEAQLDEAIAALASATTARQRFELAKKVDAARAALRASRA